MALAGVLGFKTLLQQTVFMRFLEMVDLEVAQ
jgi:hypothetical protein